MSLDPKRTLSIMIVDDEPGVRSVLNDYLSESGHEITEASGGHEAVQLLTTNPVSLIVTDIKMPNGSGLDLLDAVMDKDPSSPSVILLTGVDDISTPEALNRGAEDLLLKPFDSTTLTGVVERAQASIAYRWSICEGEQEAFPYQMTFDFESVASAQESGVLQFGRGGVFIQLSSGFPLTFERISFTFNFTTGPLNCMRGSGIVRWARPRSPAGYRNGIGVEIRFLEDEAKAYLCDVVQTKKKVPFIPIGTK